MASSYGSGRPIGRKKGGAFKTIFWGLGLGAAIGYGMLHFSTMAAARDFACARLPAFSEALSCYE